MLYLFAAQVAVAVSIATWLVILVLWGSGANTWRSRRGETQDEETDFGLLGAEVIEEMPSPEETMPPPEKEEEDEEELLKDPRVAAAGGQEGPKRDNCKRHSST